MAEGDSQPLDLATNVSKPLSDDQTIDNMNYYQTPIVGYTVEEARRASLYITDILCGWITQALQYKVKKPSYGATDIYTALEKPTNAELQSTPSTLKRRCQSSHISR